jgi:hypothetical protein
MRKTQHGSEGKEIMAPQNERPASIGGKEKGNSQDEREDQIDEARGLYFNEVVKAAKRVIQYAPNTAPATEAVMQWILRRLADQDLDELSEGQWSDLRYEVDWFTRCFTSEAAGQRQVPMRAEAWPGSPDPEELGEQPSVKAFEILRRLPSKQVVRQLQQDVQDAIDSLLRGEAAEFDLPPGARDCVRVLIRDILGKTSKWAYRFIEVRDLVPAFRDALSNVLAVQAARLAKCPGCRKRFLADRKNQDYCDALCRNRTYMRQQRGVPPERFGKRGRPRKIKTEGSIDTPQGTKGNRHGKKGR